MEDLKKSLQTGIRILIAGLIAWLLSLADRYGVREYFADFLKSFEVGLVLIMDAAITAIVFAVMAYVERIFKINVFGVKRPGDVK